MTIEISILDWVVIVLVSLIFLGVVSYTVLDLAKSNRYYVKKSKNVTKLDKHVAMKKDKNASIRKAQSNSK